MFKLDLLVNFVVHSSQVRVQHGLQFSVPQSFFRQQINFVTLVQWQRKRLLANSVQRNIHILCNQFYWASRGIFEYAHEKAYLTVPKMHGYLHDIVCCDIQGV